MLYLAGTVISFFLFLLLLIKKGKTTAENILAVWMLVLSIHQAMFYLNYSKLSYRCPHLLGLDFGLPVLHGVLLYFYVSALTVQKSMNAVVKVLHFLPFLLLMLLALPFYSLSGGEKIAVYENGGSGYEWYGQIRMPMILLSGVCYVMASLRLIRKSRAQSEHIFSNTDHKNLQWLEYLSIGLAVIWLLVFFFDDHIIFAGVATLVFLIGMFGINQLPVFSANTAITAPETEPEPAAPLPARYAKSGLKADDTSLLYDRLTLKMQQEGLYKNNDLTLAELAATLAVHPNYLSQVINEKEGKNFYQYVNMLRAAEFLRLISLPAKRHFSLLALAGECGFNSKSTFNKYVKLVSGKTPSEHLDLLSD